MLVVCLIVLRGSSGRLEKDESIFCGNEVERMYIMKVNGII